MPRKSDKRRIELLGSAGTAMALFIAGSTFGAQIAVAGTTNSGTALATADQTAVSQSTNSAAVSASIDNTLGGLQTDATSGGQTTNSVTGNDVIATATGNAFHNQIDLSLIEESGAAALGLATNQTGATISSEVTNNDVIVDLINFSNGTAVNDGNTISATTTANKGSTLLAGPLANGSSSVVLGLAENIRTTADGTLSSTAGGITASTHQTSINPTNSATAGGNMIATYIKSLADNTVTASPSVSSNAITASVNGNASQSTINIASDNTPDYTGSAVVANAQQSAGTGTSYAINSGSMIFAEVYSSNLPVSMLTGTLSLQNNTISSAASNNAAPGNGIGQAGNEILLEDGMSFTGNGNASSSGVHIVKTGAGHSSSVDSDLIIQNVQTAIGAAPLDGLTTSASTQDAAVYGSVEYLDNGAISVTGNAITATAQSNTARSMISNGEGGASFNGAAAVSNLQDNTIVAITSQAEGTITGEVYDSFMTSSVEVESNVVQASSYGNQLSQSIDLNATDLAIGTGNASVTTAMGAQVIAPATVANVQSNIATTVTAEQSSFIGTGWISQSDSSMIGSKLSASGNTQEAVAVGNSVGNALSLEGTIVGTGAAIANFQLSDPTSPVIARSLDASANADAYGDISNSEILLNANLQRAIAYGASSSNALSVKGTALTVDTVGDTGTAISTSLDSVAQSLDIDTNSAYALVNYQGQAGDVTATAQTTVAFENNVTGSLEESSTQTTNRNTYVAAAYGTDARNIASIDANAIDTQSNGHTSVATVVNAQLAAADILARAAGDTVVLSSLNGDAINSAISTSENSIQALAVANRASANHIAVHATNIDTAVNTLTVRGNASFDEATLTGTVGAAFAAQNAQFSSGSVTASLLTDEMNPKSARILTSIGDDVSGSSVISDDNLIAAAATGNRAATSILLDANQLNTSTVVQSAQMNTADLTALIGVAGTLGTPGDPGTSATPVTASGGSAQGTMSLSNDSLTVSGGSVTVNFADHNFSSEEAEFLNGLAGISGATENGSSVTFAVGTIDMSVFNNFSFSSGEDGSASGDETFTVNGFTIPGTPPTLPTFAIPNQGGVMIAIGGDIISSAVSVAGNHTSGSVIGNSASNLISATATEISNGSGLTISEAALLSTDGDLALSNLQRDTGDTESSTVYGTFAIDAIDGVIDSSSLSVSNNSQRSDAGSNVAANVIDASATNISAGTALASSQVSSAAVTAQSDLNMFAPGASTQSTIKITDNTNTARAVVNEASNVVQVTATNVTPVTPTNLADVTALAAVNADHAMLNVQWADGEASSVAASRSYNGDSESLETSGLLSGSIDFRGNATTAQSVANLASNEMTVSASANHEASAAINNAQQSSANVSADATSTVQVLLAGNEADAPLGHAANDSSIRVGNNTATAVARGNSASNVLNMDAGATYGTSGAGAPGTVDFGSNGSVTAFTATGGVLNQQSNTGTVSANSTGVVYQVALNGLDPSATVMGSSLSVSGNAVNAEAYGNTASNRIVMTALNSGAPSAAIGNYQSNTAAVTATVTNAGYGITAGSGVIGSSTFSTTGNRVAATAVGNNAVSVIAAGN